MHCNCNGRDLEPPLVVESQLLPSCNLAKISLRSDAVWKTIQNILVEGNKIEPPTYFGLCPSDHPAVLCLVLERVAASFN